MTRPVLPPPLCDWAACKAPAVTIEDGWAHCAEHLIEHRAGEREEAEQELREQQTRLREERKRARGKDITLRAAIRRLHAAGYSDREMAEQLRVTPASVKGERQKLGLKSNTVAGDPELLLPHGTHAAFNRHKNRGETPCDECRLGERVYQRNRARVRRQQQRQREAA